MICRAPIRTVVQVTAVIAVLAIIAPAFAQDVSPYKLVGGYAVYLGVIPAELITGHPKDHAEAEMHDGVPSGKHVYHVMVAIFDDASGQRVIDAMVTARVAGIGLVGTEKQLELMALADTVTYGNYFKLPGRDRYRIRIEITRPGATRQIQVEFEYDHQY